MALILLALCVAAVGFYLFVFVHFVGEEKSNRTSSRARPKVDSPERTVPKGDADERDGLKKGEIFPC
jgi:hypothetical protein